MQQEGIINIGDPIAKMIGFTDDKFDGYLWFKPLEKEIWISLITSIHPNKGNFRNIISMIKELGFIPVVPTPLANMQFILNKWRWKKTEEDAGESWRPK